MEYILDPVVTRRLKPYRYIKGVIAGNSYFDIKAGFNLGVPNMWTPASVLITIAASADVANRTVKYELFVENQIVDKVYNSTAVTASETKSFILSTTGTVSNMLKVGAHGYVELNDMSFLMGGEDFARISIASGQAADVVTILSVYRWRNWDLGMMLPKPQKGLK